MADSAKCLLPSLVLSLLLQDATMHKHKSKSKSHRWGPWSEWTWDVTEQAYVRVRQDTEGMVDFAKNIRAGDTRIFLALSLRDMKPNSISYMLIRHRCSRLRMGRAKLERKPDPARLGNRRHCRTTRKPVPRHSRCTLYELI